MTDPVSVLRREVNSRSGTHNAALDSVKTVILRTDRFTSAALSVLASGVNLGQAWGRVRSPAPSTRKLESRKVEKGVVIRKRNHPIHPQISL